MTLFDVQTGEVVGGVLDLGAVDNGVAHAHEDVLDFLQDHVHGMLVAQLHGVAGDGDVDGLSGQLGLQDLGADGSLALLQLGLDLSTDGVCHLAHDGALLGAQLAHHLQHGGQFALLAQQLDTQLLQRSGGLRSVQSSQSVLLDQL